MDEEEVYLSILPSLKEALTHISTYPWEGVETENREDNRNPFVFDLIKEEYFSKLLYSPLSKFQRYDCLEGTVNLQEAVRNLQMYTIDHFVYPFSLIQPPAFLDYIVYTTLCLFHEMDYTVSIDWNNRSMKEIDVCHYEEAWKKWKQWIVLHKEVYNRGWIWITHGTDVESESEEGEATDRKRPAEPAGLFTHPEDLRVFPSILEYKAIEQAIKQASSKIEQYTSIDYAEYNVYYALHEWNQAVVKYMHMKMHILPSFPCYSDYAKQILDHPFNFHSVKRKKDTADQ